MRIAFLLIALLSAAPCLADSKKLIVHEWGTFTSLQDETGKTIGGINQDEESLPPFVYTLQPHYGSTEEVFSKGLPAAMPEVTMRLETPVLYFYPQPPMTEPIDVHVGFKGGLLTQFYPKAATNVPDKASITPSSYSELHWKGIRLGGEVQPPKTDAHVWLAPRKVKAQAVTVANESEHYIFYRGLGNLDSPLVMQRSGGELYISARGPMRIEKLWLYEIRPDGKCAFRELAPLIREGRSEPPIAPTPMFTDTEYTPESLEKLKESMHKALVGEGLYADEATAMLSTWEQSYFKSPGLRLFFVVPRAWTDERLPLKVSVDADITRVMVGRIDMVTPWQREIVEKLRTTKDEVQWLKLYHSLGRFRAALAR